MSESDTLTNRAWALASRFGCDVDKALEYLKILSNRCPDCGGPLVRGEGVVRCAICGFTRILK